MNVVPTLVADKNLSSKRARAQIVPKTGYERQSDLKQDASGTQSPARNSQTPTRVQRGCTLVGRDACGDGREFALFVFGIGVDPF